MFNLKPLPYKLKALEPYISAQTLEFHHGKHHNAYVEKLNDLLKNKPELKDLSLEAIIKKSAQAKDLTAIFNNAAQVYNHQFFWQCLAPAEDKVTIPADLLAAINNSFTSLDNFFTEFTKLALTQFGSGWVWLSKAGDNLRIVKTANADNPLTNDLIPLFTIDVWEHAYYLDYQNRRADFVTAILNNLVNWNFVAENFRK